MKQAALDSGINYDTFKKYKRRGCSATKSYEIAHMLAMWDIRKNNAEPRVALIDPVIILSPIGFWREVVRICPEINTKGRGRPKKDDKKND